MTKPPELKPCPFCGEVPEIKERGENIALFVCTSPPCKGSSMFMGFVRDDRAKAIAAWNARTSDPAVQALVEAGNRMANSIKGDYIHPGAATAWDAALAAFDKT